MKINKIAILMGVAGLVYGTSSNAFYNVNADLTPPSVYDIAFRHRTIAQGGNAIHEINKANSSVDRGYPGFTRTSSGAYYNYIWNSNGGRFDGTLSNIFPVGLSVSMEFRHSNTSWFAGAGSNTGYYFADDVSTNIGSNNAVGTPSFKFRLIFDNQTNNNYFMYFDNSGTSGQNLVFFYYDDNAGLTFDFSYGSTNSIFHRFVLPAQSKITLETGTTSGAYYVNAWYLRNLGVSAAYTNGYDDGYEDGENDLILTGGLPGMIANIFDALTNIMNVNIFGDITLGGLMLFPLVITLFVFIMKMVKAGT
jgi:hypothetical protein